MVSVFINLLFHLLLFTSFLCIYLFVDEFIDLFNSNYLWIFLLFSYGFQLFINMVLLIYLLRNFLYIYYEFVYYFFMYLIMCLDNYFVMYLFTFYNGLIIFGFIYL